MEGKTIENILINLDMKNTAVRNNGGGFYNHNLLNVMTPNGGGPTGDLLTAIESAFGTLKSLKQNSVKQEQHNLVQVGLGFVFTKVEN
jgi:Fe-Mn family superoxide dismutase